MESLNAINFKNIPNTQYSCQNCSSVPEFLKINYRSGNIQYECPKQGEKNIGLIQYFSKELNYICENCNKHYNQINESSNLDEIFNYCTKCKIYLCQNCQKSHEHSDSFIKTSESKIKCPEHLNNFYNRYCKECKLHYCNDDEITCNHKIEEIIKPKDKDIKTLIGKKEEIMKKIEIEQSLIKILDTLISTYEKYPTNYFHSVNIINLAASLNEEETMKNNIKKKEETNNNKQDNEEKKKEEFRNDNKADNSDSNTIKNQN